MPKNKKPAGGRPAKNFDPRKAPSKKPGSRPGRPDTTARAAQLGSRSPKHRGYRPESEAAEPKKARWSADERAQKGRTPDRRAGATEHGRRDHVAGGAYRRDAHEVSGREGRQHVHGARKPSARARDRFDAERPPRRNSEFYPSKGERRSGEHEDVVLERLNAQAIEATDVEGVTFSDLGLGNNIVAALAELGAAAPFPIQAATIPVVLSGRDVLGRGRTGSGKTIAFGAPTVERLMENKGGTKRAMGRSPRALILAPTRELALQIDRTVQPIARSVGLFTTQIYGGVPQGRQVGALQRGVDIVIGTPGRIEDLVAQRKLDLSQVMITVLDEADHMCDLGFLEPVQRILRLTRPEGQKLLFSATLDTGVAALVEEFLENPAVHEVAGEDQASGTIDHRVLVVDHRSKRDVIVQLANREGKTLVFSRTRAFAEDLADELEDHGIRAVSLHGDLNQNRRTRNLAQLTSGRVNVLVATDVAARGIHVDDIDLVIQADAPDEYKTYLHRAGRTGRAGKEGRVVTLIPKQRQRRMAELLGRADIDASFESVSPGDGLLREIAGTHAR